MDLIEPCLRTIDIKHVKRIAWWKSTTFPKHTYKDIPHSTSTTKKKIKIDFEDKCKYLIRLTNDTFQKITRKIMTSIGKSVWINARVIYMSSNFCEFCKVFVERYSVLMNQKSNLNKNFEFNRNHMEIKRHKWM